MLEFFYKNNIIESKKNFYQATLAREWIYNEFEKNDYEIYEEEVATYVYESMFNGILCGHMERAIHMAEYFGKYKELEKKEYLANVLLGYGLKYVILDEKEKAMEYIQRLEDNKNKTGMKQYNQGYRRVYIGLIERNPIEFNEGLMFMLKNHKPRMKRLGNGYQRYFAYDSIALAMLAKNHGIPITAKHELLPMSYLEPAKINYDEITLFG